MAAAQDQSQQRVELFYTQWTKLCLKGQNNEPNAKQVCFTGKDARIESGTRVATAVLIEPEGEPKKLLRIMLPQGMQLVHGTRVIIDQDQPMTAPYVSCVTNGCFADYDASAELDRQNEKGAGPHCPGHHSSGQPVSMVLPLADFAKAYDGPPTNPKVVEEQKRKLQETLQRRDQARKKQESYNEPCDPYKRCLGMVTLQARTRSGGSGGPAERGPAYVRSFCRESVRANGKAEWCKNGGAFAGGGNVPNLHASSLAKTANQENVNTVICIKPVFTEEHRLRATIDGTPQKTDQVAAAINYLHERYCRLYVVGTFRTVGLAI
jgi:invasion protein IalB